MNHHAECLRNHLEIEEEANREREPIVSAPLSPIELVETIRADLKKLAEDRDFYKSRYLATRALMKEWRQLAFDRGDELEELMGIKLDERAGIK